MKNNTYPYFFSLRLLASILSLCFGLAAVQACAEDKKLEPWQQAQRTEVWEPVPLVVSAPVGGVPSDAIVLSELSAWTNTEGEPAQWTANGDSFTVKPGTGEIRTREKFCDMQLHIEWKAPEETEGLEGQARGNSGIFFQQRYEVQVLDSFGSKTYPNGQAASVYKQHIPLVNAMRSPKEWNVYDIIFHAPKFSIEGKLQKPGYVTVLHNGVLVQNHVEIQGPTSWIGHPPYEPHGCAPLALQDHDNPVSYRNIWVRKL